MTQTLCAYKRHNLFIDEIKLRHIILMNKENIILLTLMV